MCDRNLTIGIVQSLTLQVRLMNRGKIVAIITGAISILLAIAYLLLVQLLDFRGEMKPAPTSQLPEHSAMVAYSLPENGQQVGERIY